MMINDCDRDCDNSNGIVTADEESGQLLAGEPAAAAAGRQQVPTESVAELQNPPRVDSRATAFTEVAK